MSPTIPLTASTHKNNINQLLIFYISLGFLGAGRLVGSDFLNYLKYSFLNVRVSRFSGEIKLC